jgi:TfoX/Sxy family transcriptional regulator of competence genes
MPWKKANPELIALLEAQMKDYLSERRPMFGSPTFFLRGNMFAGVHEDTVILRLSDTDLKEIMARHPEVKPFTPMGGRIMKEYAALPEKIVRSKEVFRSWLNKSYSYAGSIPPKAKKPKVVKRREGI